MSEEENMRLSIVHITISLKKIIISLYCRQHGGTVVRAIASQQDGPVLDFTIWPESFCVQFVCGPVCT